MQLKDFPRPDDESRRGIHWSASVFHPDGQALDWWIHELVTMNIRWVKLLDSGSGSSKNVCQKLLANKIIPIVRLFRERPNPGHLGDGEKRTVADLVALGVRYFESSNEPNVAEEWQPGQWVPGGRPELVMQHWLLDAKVIMQLGGLPSFPALAQCGKDPEHSSIEWYKKAFQWLALHAQQEAGQAFSDGAWLAVHGAVLNHCYQDPEGQWHFEYPFDPICQGDQPNKTVMDDDNSVLGYLVPEQLLQEHFALTVPVISTEGAVLSPYTGWNRDTRYPTPENYPGGPERWHSDCTVAMFKWLESRAAARWVRANKFAMCPWLIANQRMGHNDPAWTRDAWYQAGHNMPVVDAMKALPPPVPPAPAVLNPPDETFKYSEAQIVELTRAAARQVDINEELFLRLVREECRSRRREYDYKWIEPRTFATGCCQLMPADFNANASGFYRITDLKDPVANLRAGSLYLVSLFREFGTWEKGIAAWNWGPQNLRNLLKAGYTRSWMAWLPDETRKLIRLVEIDGPRLS